MKAIIFRVFNHFANSPRNYCVYDTCLILSYQKWEENCNSRLKSLLFLARNFMFLQGKICVSARVGKSLFIAWM